MLMPSTDYFTLLATHLPWHLLTATQSSVADISIEFNSDVKFLHLENIQLRGVETMDSMPWLLRFLSNTRKSNHIEEVEIEVDIPGYHRGLVDWSAWGEVDNMLVAHFEFLQKVDIRIWRETNERKWFQETCKNLVRGLPLLGAKGVLVDVH